MNDSEHALRERIVGIVLDNTYNQDNTIGRQFGEGTPVYDVDGNKVGVVGEQGVQGDNLVLQKGLFFPHDYYVPLQAITHEDADGIYLSVTKDDVTNQAFDGIAPTSTVGDASAYSDRASSHEAAEHELLGNQAAEGVGTDSGYIDRQAGSPIADRDISIRGEGDVRVPVHEEQLNVDKQQVEAGRARIHKDVVEEQQAANVPTTHEELQVERVPVQGDAANVGPDAFTERDFDIPLRREELVANKEARVAEEVRLRKQRVTENQHVGDTVRKERVSIEGGGIEQAQGAFPPSSDAAAYEQEVDEAQPRHDI